MTLTSISLVTGVWVEWQERKLALSSGIPTLCCWLSVPQSLTA